MSDPRSRAAAWALLLAVSACGSPRGEMRVARPGPGWAEELTTERAERDRYFHDAPDSPIPTGDRASFRGLDHWPANPVLRFEGPIELHDRIERFEIPATSGAPRPCERYGQVRFEIDGRSMTLQVYRLLDGEARPGEESFFLPFTDATSGVDTYPAGRYVDLLGPRGGPYLLDFNRAYNPSCAYGDVERFACPVTPKENRLPVRIEAGERGFRHPQPKAS